MITKIVRLKHLGIFRDFKWSKDLQDFSRFNLVYGWNGSGKTTLSNLFAALPQGGIDKYARLEYQVASGSRTWTQGQQFNEQIRVFNRDYVTANVERSGGPNPIFILGESNKQLVDQIQHDEAEISEREEALAAGQSKLATVRSQRDRLFTDTARTISQNVTGESSRTYRKPNAESDFARLTEKTLLSDDQLALYRGTLAQQQLPALDILDVESLQDQLDKIVSRATELLNVQVASVAITRLTQNPEISRWVESGLAIHKEHNSDSCEFCGKPVSKERLDSLAEHFNEADAQLKRQLGELSRSLEAKKSALGALTPRDSANLYAELRQDYRLATADFSTNRELLQADMEKLSIAVEGKKVTIHHP
jgi:wobble nucleotide-excising tRNase